jgi:hypothetical protein
MPFAPLLALAAVAGAVLLTYLCFEDAPLWPRLCAGVCVGFALLGLAGFVFASVLGMGAASLALAGVACASPLLLLLRTSVRVRLAADASEAARVLRSTLTLSRGGRPGALAFYAAAALLFWLVFAHAMYRTEAGLFTGVDTNIGDMPFHAAVVTGFAYGENFPPEHPEFAGARLTYPFVVDFVAAMFVRAGATLEGAMFWQSFLTMMSLVGLLHWWALKLLAGRRGALLVPPLVLLSGGFGWWTFVGEAASGGRGVFELLSNLEHDYTIMGHIGYRWGNAVTALFVTQRSILLGLSLALVAWTLWWEASVRKTKGGGESSSSSEADVEGQRARGKKVRSKGRKAQRGVVKDDEVDADPTFAFCLSPFALRPMLAAGLVTGLLPLVHAHSFVVMMSMGACAALLQGAVVLASDVERDEEEARASSAFERLREVWLPWVAFALAACVLAVPQMLWATKDSSVDASRFFGWEFGWDRGQANVVWFWLKNTGVFIPLLVVALAWWARERARFASERARGVARPRSASKESPSGRLVFFYLPFVLCFVVPNVYKLSPWVWDNIKVLFYWWVASAPLVALVVARLWRERAWRAAAVLLVLMQTAAGGLDVWRAASGSVERLEIDAGGLAFAELIKQRTPPRALILHAPVYNDPVYLTGRRTFLGYPGHVWSHGLEYTGREAVLNRIYAGGPDAAVLLDANRIEYVVVGPLERGELSKSGAALDESFFRRFEKVGEAGDYILYKTSP